MKLKTTALIAILVGATSVAIAQPAPQLFRVKQDTYGCANPRATRALTNHNDPRQADPKWVAFVLDDGHCVAVTPRSQWRLVFRDGDLAFMTYAGTTAGPGSFYIRVDELSDPIQAVVAAPDAALPSATTVEPTRPAVTSVPLASPVHPTPQPTTDPSAAPKAPFPAPKARVTRDEGSPPAAPRPASTPQVPVRLLG